MERWYYHSKLPHVEYWLIPVVFVFIVGLTSLIDSQPSCDAICTCIERANAMNPLTLFSCMRHRKLVISGPSRKPTRTLFDADASQVTRRYPWPASAINPWPLSSRLRAGCSVHDGASLALLSVFYAFPP